MQRCTWPKTELEIKYHDIEWGVPCHDDNKLFEYMVLDTFQAGLSWSLMLAKREGFREAFLNFDPKEIIKMTNGDIEKLLQNPEIIRNRQKISSTIHNANRSLDIQSEFGTFDNYIWRFSNGKTIDNQVSHDSDIATTSIESHAMSKDLKQRGFKFVGPTICYAFMQGIGMVNDHLVSCFRHSEV